MQVQTRLHLTRKQKDTKQRGRIRKRAEFYFGISSVQLSGFGRRLNKFVNSINRRGDGNEVSFCGGLESTD
jgi:hypothetical protein